MSFASITRQAFATMGKNRNLSRMVAAGQSYFRWTASGAAFGGIEQMTSNAMGWDPEGRGSVGGAMKSGAISGFSSRAAMGIHGAMKNRMSAARARAGGR